MLYSVPFLLLSDFTLMNKINCVTQFSPPIADDQEYGWIDHWLYNLASCKSSAFTLRKSPKLGSIFLPMDEGTRLWAITRLRLQALRSTQRWSCSSGKPTKQSAPKGPLTSSHRNSPTVRWLKTQSILDLGSVNLVINLLLVRFLLLPNLTVMKKFSHITQFTVMQIMLTKKVTKLSILIWAN